MKTDLISIANNKNLDDMIQYINNHPHEFDDLLQMAFGNSSNSTWRVVWWVKNCMEPNDKRLLKYIDTMIDRLEELDESSQREYLRILDTLKLNDDQEGLLYDKCVNIWKSIFKKPGVRYNSFRIIIKTAQKYPELMNEVSFLTQKHYLDTLSHGIKHSIKKLISLK